MQAAAFKVFCPVEIGDVIVKEQESNTAKVVLTTDGRRAKYMISSKERFYQITDIATIHYVKTGKVKFMYELNSDGQYRDLEFAFLVK